MSTPPSSTPRDPDEPTLPEQTRDDLDLGWGGSSSASSSAEDDDERFLRERPPHWE